MRSSIPTLISPILDLNPLKRARAELKLAPGFLVRSAPKPRRVVDRVGAGRPKRLFFADARWCRCSCSTRERRQPQVLRRRVSVDDVVRSRRALKRGYSRRGGIIDMHEAVYALALTNNRNLLLPYLNTNIALARVPGAGAVEESIPQRDELDSRRRRCARLQFHVGAGAGLDSRGRAGDERDGLVCRPRAGRIPESGTLQQVAAHTRIAKRRKQVDVAFRSDLAIAFRRCLHVGGRVVPGQ